MPWGGRSLKVQGMCPQTFYELAPIGKIFQPHGLYTFITCKYPHLSFKNLSGFHKKNHHSLVNSYIWALQAGISLQHQVAQVNWYVLMITFLQCKLGDSVAFTFVITLIKLGFGIYLNVLWNKFIVNMQVSNLQVGRPIKQTKTCRSVGNGQKSWELFFGENH